MDLPKEAPASERRAADSLLGALVVVLALAAAFILCLEPVAITDFWWQARTGGLILETGRIPTRDPFSWTAAGQPWVVHEWLTEILFYLAYTRLPHEVLLLFKAGMGALACALVLLRAWRRCGSILAAAGATVAAAYALCNYADLRPQMFSLVLVAGLLLALDLYRDGRVKWLPWVLPPVFALWGNLHGGVVVGLILLGLWVAGEALGQAMWREQSPGLAPLGLGAAVSAGALALNPNGFGVYFYPFQVLGHPEVMGYITEWWSPNFHQPRSRAFEGLLLAVIVALAVRPRGPGSYRVGELLVLLALTHAALLAQRNTALFALAAGPVIATGAAAALREAADRIPSDARRVTYRTGLVLTVAALGALSAVKVPRAPLSGWWERAVGWSTFPHGAAARMRHGAWPGRLYNDYVWGGFLIWELYPRRPVFIDGRAEVYYPTGAFDDEIKIHRAAAGWQEAMDRRGVEVVLTEKGGTLAAALNGAARWRLDYTGEVEAVYLRVR